MAGIFRLYSNLRQRHQNKNSYVRQWLGKSTTFNVLRELNRPLPLFWFMVQIGQQGCPIRQDAETIECNPQNCPRFDQWTGWSSCSVSCGGGDQTRTRSCLYGVQDDAGCQGMMAETRICNAQVNEVYRSRRRNNLLNIIYT